MTLAELKQCLQTVAGSLESKSKTAKVEFMHSRKSKLLIAKAFDDVMNNVSNSTSCMHDVFPYFMTSYSAIYFCYTWRAICPSPFYDYQKLASVPGRFFFNRKKLKNTAWY